MGKEAYLTIPKEKAARIITAKNKRLVVYKKQEDKINIGLDKPDNTDPSDYWRVTLSDYKFQGSKVETADGVVKSGLLGSKIKYRDHKFGKRAKKSVSDHIETG